MYICLVWHVREKIYKNCFIIYNLIQLIYSTRPRFDV